ncbi:MAG: helix-turn-helix domain-containing protein [Gemmatimonadetes bacterium]|nr:helix-turn-helix domain-containing protein [Gemmatimonadota bacterium]
MGAPWGGSLAVQRVAAGEPRAAVARGCGVTPRTVTKWEGRAHAAGSAAPAALQDRSSRPHRLARQLPRHQRRQILRSRRKRWISVRIAQHYTLAVSTVLSFLRRPGLNRVARLEPVRPIQRCERRRPARWSTST